MSNEGRQVRATSKRHLVVDSNVWIVERTGAWFDRFRRLQVRDERRADIHAAFISLATALSLLGYLPARY